MMVQNKMEVKMKNLIWILPMAFAFGCGDKDEDTGSEVTEDTSEDTAEDTGGE
jgi:hypothetical protein